MRWLENIRLRMSPHQVNRASRELQTVVGEIGREEGLDRIKLFINALQSGDIALNLYWDTPRVSIRGSRLGLSLAASLKRFGMINHSIWTEAAAHAIGDEPEPGRPETTQGET